eukprot:1003835_1
MLTRRITDHSCGSHIMAPICNQKSIHLLVEQRKKWWPRMEIGDNINWSKTDIIGQEQITLIERGHQKVLMLAIKHNSKYIFGTPIGGMDEIETVPTTSVLEPDGIESETKSTDDPPTKE